MPGKKVEIDTCGTEFDPAELEIQVCMSAAGYYIGTMEPCGAPYSRLSGYFDRREDAEHELKIGWIDRGADENEKQVKAMEAGGKLKRRPLN